MPVYFQSHHELIGIIIENAKSMSRKQHTHLHPPVADTAQQLATFLPAWREKTRPRCGKLVLYFIKTAAIRAYTVKTKSDRPNVPPECHFWSSAEVYQQMRASQRWPQVFLRFENLLFLTFLRLFRIACAEQLFSGY